MSCISSFILGHSNLISLRATTVTSCAHGRTHSNCLVATTPYTFQVLFAPTVSMQEKPEFIYIKNIRSFFELTSSLTIKLQSSSVGDFSSEVEEQEWVIDIDDLLGCNSEDFYSDIDPEELITDRRYWRVLINSSSSVSAPLGFVFLGRKIDFGVAPITPVLISLEKDIPDADMLRMVIRLRFQNLEASKKNEIAKKIVQHSNLVPFLIIDFNDAILFGEKVLLTYLRRVPIFEIENKNMQYSTDIELEQVL